MKILILCLQATILPAMFHTNSSQSFNITILTCTTAVHFTIPALKALPKNSIWSFFFFHKTQYEPSTDQQLTAWQSFRQSPLEKELYWALLSTRPNESKSATKHDGLLFCILSKVENVPMLFIGILEGTIIHHLTLPRVAAPWHQAAQTHWQKHEGLKGLAHTMTCPPNERKIQP